MEDLTACVRVEFERYGTEELVTYRSDGGTSMFFSLDLAGDTMKNLAGDQMLAGGVGNTWY